MSPQQKPSALNAQFTNASQDAPALITQIADVIAENKNKSDRTGYGIYADDRMIAAVFPVNGLNVDVVRYDDAGNEAAVTSTSLYSPFAKQEIEKALRAAGEQTAITLGKVQRQLAQETAQHKAPGWVVAPV